MACENFGLALSPSRLYLTATWLADSSPEKYKTFLPASAKLPAACKAKVDLPTPGAPPSKTTPPATKPPPKTRSNSLSPLAKIWSVVIFASSKSTKFNSVPASVVTARA